MFSIATFGTALLAAHAAYALPRPDSSSGDEVGVRAPNGTPITDTAELASQSSAEAASSAAAYNGGYNNYNNGGYYTQAATTSLSVDSATVSYSSYVAAETSAYVDTTSAELSYSYSYSSASVVDYTSTSEAVTTTSVSYGSGSSSWDSSSGYDSCVQQCLASYGNPMATYTPSSSSSYSDSSYDSSSNSSSGSSGSGATHTIIVAPTQGVLRYVPFATNASVGDTIKFMWNANMHTVTKSSELEVCNKTLDAPFTSGIQNQSFVFTQVVNDTNPTFFYCGVPTHCQKGMFGIINPPSAADASTSVAGMMSSVVSNDSNVAAWAAYTQNMTAGNAAASSWGLSMDMSNIPEWAYSDMMENVMYTQNFLAANPDVLAADGSVDLGATSAPLMIPQDLNAVLDSSSSSSTSPASTDSASAAASSGSSSASTAGAASSGARGLKTSSFLVGAAAFGVVVFAL